MLRNDRIKGIYSCLIGDNKGILQVLCQKVLATYCLPKSIRKKYRKQEVEEESSGGDSCSKQVNLFRFITIPYSSFSIRLYVPTL